MFRRLRHEAWTSWSHRMDAWLSPAREHRAAANHPRARELSRRLDERLRNPEALGVLAPGERASLVPLLPQRASHPPEALLQDVARQLEQEDQKRMLDRLKSLGMAGLCLSARVDMVVRGNRSRSCHFIRAIPRRSDLPSNPQTTDIIS